MRQKILEWLKSGGSYAQGVAIYKEFGANAALKILFSGKESAFNSAKLKAELSAMAEQAAPVQKSYEKPEYQITDLSRELQSEFKRKGRLYTEASQLHSDLFHENDQAKCAELRKGITSRFDEIAAIWRRCDAYVLAKQKRPTTQADLLQHRNNLRTRISKAKARNQPDKLASLQDELAQVEKQLQP